MVSDKSINFKNMLIVGDNVECYTLQSLFLVSIVSLSIPRDVHDSKAIVCVDLYYFRWNDVD